MWKVVFTAAAVAANAFLFPSCAGSQLSVADARQVVFSARQAQAVACALPAASRLPEACLQASHYLQLAEVALKGAQELESAAQKAVDAGLEAR